VPYDQRGLEVTAASTEAVRHLDATVDAYLGFRLDTGNHLKATLAADPEMPLAHVLRGYFFQLFGLAALFPKAEQSLKQAEAVAGRQGANARERLHLAALAHWRRGDMAAAAGAWDDILLDWPTDAMALRLSHFAHFYSGDGRRMRDAAARAVLRWDEGVPGYNYALGVLCFALEEAGQYADAEPHGRRAVALDPTDVWSTHAVAHVLEMQGRHEEGVAWLEGLSANWGGVNNFAGHVWWHLALYHLELGRHDRVLELYDGQFRKESTEDYLDIANAASMLQRLAHRGVDVGRRWEELADRAATRLEDRYLTFADVHFALALAAAGRTAELAALRNSMRRAAEGTDWQAAAARTAGLALVDAIAAWGAGDRARCAALLREVRYAVPAIGGSHAQRDLFHEMLATAAVTAGDARAARAAAAERLAARPSSPFARDLYARATAAA